MFLVAAVFPVAAADRLKGGGNSAGQRWHNAGVREGRDGRMDGQTACPGHTQHSPPGQPQTKTHPDKGFFLAPSHTLPRP